MVQRRGISRNRKGRLARERAWKGGRGKSHGA